MRIKTKAIWALAAMLGSTLVLTSAGHASAHDWLKRLQTKLELTADQANAIQGIYARDAENRRQLGQALRQAQSDLRRLALSGADEATIAQKTGEVEALLAQSLQLRVRHLQEIAPLLTPGQRERFAELRSGGSGMRRPPHDRPTPGASS
jgi:Spy/CpxP family protein refolding chaperone